MSHVLNLKNKSENGMLLKELIQERKNKESKTGSYVAVRFSDDSQDRLTEFAKQRKLNNLVPTDKYHITVIYSRKPISDGFKAYGLLEDPLIVQPNHLSIFPTQSGSNALVLELEAPQLKSRHKELMDKYDLEYDFDEYKAHVTLSYDCGEYKPSDDEDYSSLEDLEIVEEYHEPLNLNWAKENT